MIATPVRLPFVVFQAGARLGEAALPLLANEAYRETLAVARFERDYKIMAQAHKEIYQFMNKANKQETVVRTCLIFRCLTFVFGELLVLWWVWGEAADDEIGWEHTCCLCLCWWVTVVWHVRAIATCSGSGVR